MLGDRYFDDAGAVLRKSICYRVADLLRPFHVVPLGPVNLGKFIKPGIDQVHSYVTLVIVPHLLCLFSPVAVVI